MNTTVLLNPKSIMVSTSCLKEVNQLRETHRKDLLVYSVPLEPRTGTKRKLTATRSKGASNK